MDHNARMSAAAGESDRSLVPTSLFIDITTITVDPAYVEAAARRAQRGEPPRRWRTPSGLLALALVAAVGVLLAAAAVQTRRGAPAAARLRDQLREEAARRTETTDALRAQAEQLRAGNAAARARQLRTSRDGAALASRLEALEMAAGGVAVIGPGVVVTLDDAPDAGGADDPDENGRIRDRDVQEVVNALWAAGVEAVAVNGQRVGVLTAIREAGEAILVDYRPVTAPYVIAAIGDADVVEPAFGDSTAARRFTTWKGAYGLRFDVRRDDRLELPATESTRLRHATAVP